jgi:hypothetical protein
MVDFDRSLLGRLFETSSPVKITAEMIASFCAMMSETNSVYSNPLHAEESQRSRPQHLWRHFARLRISSTTFQSMYRGSRPEWMSSLSSPSERAMPSRLGLNSPKVIRRLDGAV